MARLYSMRGVQHSASRAVALAVRHLRAQDEQSRVHDVQHDPRFQHRGVDLLWERPGQVVLGIEVKGDRNARSGNYFFELVSNLEKDTPGCFLYSIADVLLYVFLEQTEVHHLPLGPLRDWFLPRAREFPLKTTRTRAGRSSYTTVGAIVPVQKVLSEVEGAWRIRMAEPV